MLMKLIGHSESKMTKIAKLYNYQRRAFKEIQIDHQKNFNI